MDYESIDCFSLWLVGEEGPVLRLNDGKRLRTFNLGPLEWQAMEIVWRSKACSVNDVVDRLQQPRRYTTVMTTLSRLYHKGLLSRTLSHRRFLYSARMSRQDLEHASADYFLSRILSIQSDSTTPDVIMRYLVETLSRHNAELFNQALQTVSSNTQPKRPRSYAEKSRAPGSRPSVGR